jgi:hypothetical protein
MFVAAGFIRSLSDAPRVFSSSAKLATLLLDARMPTLTWLEDLKQQMSLTRLPAVL